VYEGASVSFEWTPVLKEACEEFGIEYFTSPYDFDAVEHVAQFVPAFKVGSGEIDWIEALEHMAAKGKPMMLATGASDMADVQRAVHAILRLNKELVLMQCNTNYTASADTMTTSISMC
jgi:N-acetylneuraminate synthase